MMMSEPASPIITKERIWSEINLDYLKHNVKQLQSLMPKRCKIMAVVKANAYGHGDIETSKELNKLGVTSFAVATLKEGIRLREHDIKGDILILGYTHPDAVSEIAKYDLIQTVVSLSHGEALNQKKQKIRIHLKIDTGMHRLGIDSALIAQIQKIYSMRYLNAEGLFTHFSVADSHAPEDIAYTHSQIQSLQEVVSHMKALGYHPGKIHMQSSYGLLNYPIPDCDYARVGIALYGAQSNMKITTNASLSLFPILSLKARVACIRELTQGEMVGYDRSFIVTSAKTRVAVITAGYADGIPRSLSGGKGLVLLHGKFAPIIGNICMDQLMIDISQIPETQEGDMVTLIGKEGEREIPVTYLAEATHSISNEILSCLGSRVDHIYIKSGIDK